MGNANETQVDLNEDQFQSSLASNFQEMVISTKNCVPQSQQIYTDEMQFSSQQLCKVRQQEMGHPLHKNIVAIISRSKLGIMRGSGLLISENLVLTCAHNFFIENIYQTKVRIEDKLFEIYHGPYGPMTGPYKIQKSFIPEEYRQSKQSKSIYYDYALVKLTQKVKSNQFLPLKADVIKSEDMQIAIFGYPLDSYQQIGKWQTLYESFQKGLIRKNVIQDIQYQKYQIVHQLSTNKGQSGCPVIQLKGSKMQVIGIHKGGLKRKGMKFNVARLIDQQLLQILQREANNLQASLFLIAQTQFSDYKKSIKMGQSSFRLGNYSSAQKCFQKCIQLDPDNWEAHNDLGITFKTLGKIENAIECYNQAIKLNPNQALPINNLGSALQNQGKEKQAEECFRQAIDKNPNLAAAYNNLGLLLKNQDRIEEAIKCYQACIRLSPKSEQCYFNLGILYFQLHKKQQAVEYYKQAIQINPRFLNAHYRLGLTYCDLEKYSQSISQMQKCIDIQPSFKQAAYLLKRLSNKRKK